MDALAAAAAAADRHPAPRPTWNVDEVVGGRELLDKLATEDSDPQPTLTERLPLQFSPHKTDDAFMDAGCRIVTRLNEVSDLPQGVSLRALFTQPSHHAPADRAYSYVFPLDRRARQSNGKGGSAMPDGNVRLTQQGTGYFYPRYPGFDPDHPLNAEGTISSTMNAKDSERSHLVVGRMWAPDEPHAMPRCRDPSAPVLRADPDGRAPAPAPVSLQVQDVQDHHRHQDRSCAAEGGPVRVDGQLGLRARRAQAEPRLAEAARDAAPIRPPAASRAPAPSVRPVPSRPPPRIDAWPTAVCIVARGIVHGAIRGAARWCWGGGANAHALARR